MTATPIGSEDPRAAVDRALAARVATLRAEVHHLSPTALPLVDALERMLSGGKRMRSAFTYWTWRAYGGDPTGPQAAVVAHIGAAHELFQASALIHDDVMDDSDTRRGMPSVHRLFATHHRTQSLTGDARRFGDSAAILLGDLALIASEQEIATALCDEPRDRAEAVRSVFDQMRAEVTIGQYLDTLAQAQPWGHDPGADEARARQVIRTKSARYSVEHPVVIGALLADANPQQVAVCRAIGLPLGEAFQLRDDLLGVFGDPDVTGKPSGDDLREGKRTVLVARALDHALTTGDDATVGLLVDGLGDRLADTTTIDRLTAAIVATGAVREVEQLIAELSETALRLMAAQDWSEPAATQLTALAHAAVDRQA